MIARREAPAPQAGGCDGNPGAEAICGAWRYDGGPPAYEAGGRSASGPGVTCLVAGRLDNRAELRAGLRASRASAEEDDDAGLVLAAYRQFGDELAGHLEGEIGVAICDRRNRRLLLIRDRIGVQPMCYAEVPGGVLFGSSAVALLAMPGAALDRALDEEVLAQTLLGSLAPFCHERTHFRAVRSLPPAHVARFDGAGRSLRPYFDFQPSPRRTGRAFGELAEEFRSLYQRAVERRMRGRRTLGVSLSGGLDSSLLLATAVELARSTPGVATRLVAFHMQGLPGGGSDETERARAAAQALGVPLVLLPPHLGFLRGAPSVIETCEAPGLGVNLNLADDLFAAASAEHCDGLLTGHWGDQCMLRHDYLVDLLSAGNCREWQRQRRCWHMGVGAALWLSARDLAERRLPGQRRLRRLRARLGDGAWNNEWYTAAWRRRLREGFATPRVTAPAGSALARAIYRKLRAPYTVLAMAGETRLGARRGLPTLSPMLEPSLIQHLMDVPGDLMHHEGMDRALARIHLPPALPARAPIEKGNFTDLADRGVAADFAGIRELLHAGSRAVELGYLIATDWPQRLETWRRRMERTPGDNTWGWRFSELCGLELFLRRFAPAGGAAG